MDVIAPVGWWENMSKLKFISHEPEVRDLETFCVFNQHPKWVITPVNM